MSSARGPGVAIGLLILVGTSGCGTLESNKARLQELVGRPAQSVTARLGAPADIRAEGTVEVLRYEFRAQDTRPTSTRSRTRIGEGAFPRTTEESLCTLTLAVQNRVVTEVRCQGGIPGDSTADALCVRAVVERFGLR